MQVLHFVLVASNTVMSKWICVPIKIPYSIPIERQHAKVMRKGKSSISRPIWNIYVIWLPVENIKEMYFLPST